MSLLHGVILPICAASLFLGALYLIRPTGNTEKGVRFCFALIFLCIIVFALTRIPSIKGVLRLPAVADYTEYSADLNGALAEQVVAAALEQANIKYSKISVLMDKSLGGGISIKRITVYSSAEKSAVEGAVRAVIETNGVEVINE